MMSSSNDTAIPLPPGRQRTGTNAFDWLATLLALTGLVAVGVGVFVVSREDQTARMASALTFVLCLGMASAASAMALHLRTPRHGPARVWALLAFGLHLLFGFGQAA
jgi:hypothetical protein